MVIGMHSPMPLDAIYQPTRLILEAPIEVVQLPTGEKKQVQLEDQTLTPRQFVAKGIDGVLFAGPGWGKTTLLHYLFMTTLRENKNVVPVLFTLRRPSGLADFRKFIDVLRKLKKRGSRQTKFLLLVDGYDEVSTAERKEISDALMLFAVSDAGNYLLTCRDFYDVYELRAGRLRIGEFSEGDQLRLCYRFYWRLWGRHSRRRASSGPASARSSRPTAASPVTRDGMYRKDWEGWFVFP
jgi:hypothetical protein